MKTKIDFQDTTKKNDAVVASINAQTTQYIEIYDNHLNYNSDFKDKVGEDVSNEVYVQAESSNEVGYSAVVPTTPTVFGTDATMQFYVIGACCYYFNPCVSLKLGYHVRFTVDDATKELDADVYKQSAVAAKKEQLLATIKAKNDKNITPASMTTA